MVPPKKNLELEAIRLLAHPLRQRIERELRRGPATATSLARALGENSGLTSYHLRKLAEHGFVEEVPELGHGRERWWRYVPRDRRFPPRSEQSPQMRAVLDELTAREFAADFARFARGQRDTEKTDPWADAYPISRGSINVTLDEFRQFFEEYIALLNKYQRPDGEQPPGYRTVATRFFAYPEPAEDDS
jgi:DNA-binding transcriptional ArsR family regulator